MDTVGNMLNSIINAQAVGKARIVVPYSSFQFQLAEFLQSKGLLAKIKADQDGKPTLQLTLKYDDDKTPAMARIKRLSKPGRRLYSRKQNIPYSIENRGMIVISTSQGLMDDKEARRKNVGGELICEIW